jgi:hypothetical protein
MSKKHQLGVSLIEVVIGSAIIVTGILALTEGYGQYVKYALANQKNIQAAYLVEEGLEVMTYIRDRGWATYIAPLSTGTAYYIAWNGSAWNVTTTPQYIDSIFLREIRVAEVVRDSGDRISSSGTADPNTKLLSVYVSYVQGTATTTKTISTYITNLNAD